MSLGTVKGSVVMLVMILLQVLRMLLFCGKCKTQVYRLTGLTGLQVPGWQVTSLTGYQVYRLTGYRLEKMQVDRLEYNYLVTSLG